MTLRPAKNFGIPTNQQLSVSSEPANESLRSDKGSSSDPPQGSVLPPRVRSAAAPLAAGLQFPEVTSKHQGALTPSSTLAELPDELKLMVVGNLYPEAALQLRQASSDFLRLSDDPKVLREQFIKVRSALPAKGLKTPGAREAAWGELGRIMHLRHQYAIGPTSMRVIDKAIAGALRLSDSPNGRFLLDYHFRDGLVRLYDIQRGLPQGMISLEENAREVMFSTFSADSRFALTAARDGTARVWSLEQVTPRSIILEGHTDRLTNATFSPDGRFALTASVDRTARLWDLAEDPPQVSLIMEHTDKVSTAIFSPDGQCILTAADHGDARLWDLRQDPPQVAVLTGHTARIYSAHFSPNGRYILTASDWGPARLWDREQEPLHAVFLGRQNIRMTQATFSPDGRFVFTISDDKKLHLWDLEQEIPQAVVLGSRSVKISQATFSPDGRFILTTSDWDSALLWDREQRPPQAVSLPAPLAEVKFAMFSPNGRFILTVSRNGKPRLYDFLAPREKEEGAAPPPSRREDRAINDLLQRWFQRSSVREG